MQPGTVEAYRVSSGVNIPAHIEEHENRIRRNKLIAILASVAIVIVSVIVFFTIPHDMPGRGLLLFIGVVIAAVVCVLAFTLPSTTYSIELQDFLDRANRVLPLTKKDMSSHPFEERVRLMIHLCSNEPALRLATAKMDAAYFGLQ